MEGDGSQKAQVECNGKRVDLQENVDHVKRLTEKDFLLYQASKAAGSCNASNAQANEATVGAQKQEEANRGKLDLFVIDFEEPEAEESDVEE